MEFYFAFASFVVFVSFSQATVPTPDLWFGFEEKETAYINYEKTRFTIQPQVGSEGLSIKWPRTSSYTGEDKVFIVDGINGTAIYLKTVVKGLSYVYRDECLHKINCQGLTVSAWVKLNSVEGRRAYTIIRTGNAGIGSTKIFEGFFLNVDTNEPYPLRFIATSTNGTKFTASIHNQYMGIWVHLAVSVSDFNGLNVYVNGEIVEDYYAAPDRQNVTNVNLGSTGQNFGDEQDDVDFYLDEVKFWYKELSATELFENYDNDLPQTTTVPLITTTEFETTATTPDVETTEDTTIAVDKTTKTVTEESGNRETTQDGGNLQTTPSATLEVVTTSTLAGDDITSQNSNSGATSLEGEHSRPTTDSNQVTSIAHTSADPNAISTPDDSNASITPTLNWSSALFLTTDSNDLSTTNLDETTEVVHEAVKTLPPVVNTPEEESNALLHKAEQLQSDVEHQITDQTTTEVANEVNENAITQLTEIRDDLEETDLSDTESVALMATVSTTANKVLSKDVEKNSDLLVVVDDIVKVITDKIHKEDVPKEPIVTEAWSIYVVEEEQTKQDLMVSVGAESTVQVSSKTLIGSSGNGVENTNVVFAAYEYQLPQDSVKIPASKFEESEENEEELQLISTILIIVIYPVNNKTEKVTFTQQITNSSKEKLLQKSHIAVCVSINATTKNWTSEGCQAKNDGTIGSVTCECSHLTNFAILMQVVVFKIPKYHQQNLKLITFIGSSISIFCLISSLLVFLLIKSGQYVTDDSSNNVKGHRTERYHIHANLALSILLGQVTFLSGSGEKPNTISCKVTAILLHFFFLAAFSWMLVEGLHLYNLVVKVFRSSHSRLGYYYMVGWGSPLLICVISVAAAYSGYGETGNCWLEVNNSGVIWAFVGPALFVVVVNIFVLIKVTRVISNLSNAKDNCKNALADKQTIIVCAKAVAVLLPILGSTWLFGILAFNEKTIIFQYVFVITNSLQGFFLFIFHVVLNNETRSALIYKTGSIHTSVINSSFSSSRKKKKHDDSTFTHTRSTSYSKMNSRSTPDNSVTSSNEWSNMEMSQQSDKKILKEKSPNNSRPSSAISSRISPAPADEHLYETCW